jgi:ribosomal-protein-serine acetyltransferase
MERGVNVLPEWIEGDGLLLRRWRVDDADALGQAVSESDDHLRPWLAFMAGEPQTREQRKEMLREREREWAAGGDVMLAIIVGGAVPGSCGLHRRRGPITLELGYWIHPRFTRRGLATAVARLLTDAAFSVPDIDRVEIHHDKANTASSGVPKKLGFSFVGETPDDGNAPAAVGIDCTWRMERDDWQMKRLAS